MTDMADQEVDRAEKIAAIIRVARYNPKFAVFILFLGLAAAVLEGIGLSFILPIIEIVQLDDPVAEADGLLEIFVLVYDALGVPFTLGFVVVGLAAVMTVRFTTSFLVAWLSELLRYNYRRYLQNEAFQHGLEARMAYFDEEGSDEILNAIITETSMASNVIKRIVAFLEKSFLASMYLIIALVISPLLTLLAILVLGGITLLLRSVIEPGYNIGDLVADANEKRHAYAQAGMMGIRDIRIYNLTEEIGRNFANAIDQYTHNKAKLRRNEAAIKNFYNLSVAIFVFVLIFLALRFANLSFAELGLFLFVMFQLGPKVSSLNTEFYQLENLLPHLVRTHRFIDELKDAKEPEDAAHPAPASVETLSFDDVHFSYGDDEIVLRGIDFTVERGEFIAFVGQSGAGKSTIVSLLARFYEPDRGIIYANEVPIAKMDPGEWRDQLAIVRQNPFIFNASLRYNLTIGNRDVSQHAIDRACSIAKVDEFLDQLPHGFDTELGDDGVRLSGGQKQRVSLARALLTDAQVLVLDEATSDLDSHLEREVQRAIESMNREYTIIAIAHRLSTVKNADRIYTMEGGVITEQGPHAELVHSDGKYSELYTIQSTG